MIRNLENQMCLFPDATAGSDQGSRSGRTSEALSPATPARTSERSLPSLYGSSNRKLPIFLYLRKDGPTPEWCTGTDGPSPGLPIAPAFLEFPSGESASLWSRTSGDYLPVRSCLSAVLDYSENRKYWLSPKACLGILRRAERRGKTLPEELKTALIRQSALKDTSSTGNPPRTAEAGVGGGSYTLDAVDRPAVLPVNVTPCISSR